MKIAKQLSLLLLFMGVMVSANAQTGASDLVKEWERAKAYTREYLEAMPDASYGLKPTPQMRSFADQMLHIADGNYGFASAASGEKSPVAQGGLEKGTDKSKATVMKETLASYDFVIAALQKMKPAQVNEKLKLFGRFDMTKAQAFEKVFEHQTHHRGQATVYLRLAGVTPPNEKLF